MRKVIIVEGKTDDYFIKVLKPNIESIGVEFSKLGGGGNDDKAKVRRELELQRRNFELSATDGLGQLGIILDLDSYSIEQRLEFLNDSIQKVFGISLEMQNQAKTAIYSGVSLEISCLFIDSNLDVLLRRIANQPSPIADCFSQCLNQEPVRQKENDKEWIDTYMRYDICTFQERGNARDNVTYKFTAAKNAWQLDSPVLNDLIQFLNKFD